MRLSVSPAFLIFAFFVGSMVIVSCGTGTDGREKFPKIRVSGQVLYDKRILPTDLLGFRQPDLSQGITATDLTAVRYAHVVAINNNSGDIISEKNHQTNAVGEFDLELDNNGEPFRIRVYSMSLHAPTRVEVNNPKNSYKPFLIESDVLVEPRSGLLLHAPINPVNCVSPPPTSPAQELTELRRSAPAFNIFDTLIKGMEWFHNQTLLDPPRVKTVWFDGSSTPATVSYYAGIIIDKTQMETQLTRPISNLDAQLSYNGNSTFTLSNGPVIENDRLDIERIAGVIYISGDNSRDPDQYDDHVILHCLAKYFLHLYSRDDSPTPESKPDFDTNEQLYLPTAWSEGFCNYFACSVLNRATWVDTGAIANPCTQGNPTSRYYNLERANVDAVPIQKMLARYPLDFPDSPDGGVTPAKTITLDSSRSRLYLYDNKTTVSATTNSRGYPRFATGVTQTIPSVDPANAGGGYTNTPTISDIIRASGTGFGSQVAVAGLLFDLSDAPALDTDSDAVSSVGFAPIWDVVSNYLPQQKWVYLGDFIDGWFKMGYATSGNTTALDSVMNPLAIFYKPVTDPALIGDIGNPGTGEFDTFPQVTTLFGASTSPVKGNNLRDPDPNSTGGFISTEANSANDPFAPPTTAFPSTGPATRMLWRSSSTLYAVDIPKAGRIRIELTTPTSTTGGGGATDLDIIMYDPYGRRMRTQLTCNVNPQVVDMLVDSGLHYFLVVSWQRSSGGSACNAGSSSSLSYNFMEHPTNIISIVGQTPANLPVIGLEENPPYNNVTGNTTSGAYSLLVLRPF
ncbi:MAG: hypothetical protein NUW37_03395 [Planctomycetes bacterium]|nr:hypothetical protein [Planctomycetota bacterium]